MKFLFSLCFIFLLAFECRAQEVQEVQEVQKQIQDEYRRLDLKKVSGPITTNRETYLGEEFLISEEYADLRGLELYWGGSITLPLWSSVTHSDSFGWERVSDYEYSHDCNSDRSYSLKFVRDSESNRHSVLKFFVNGSYTETIETFDGKGVPVERVFPHFYSASPISFRCIKDGILLKYQIDQVVYHLNRKVAAATLNVAIRIIETESSSIAVQVVGISERSDEVLTNRGMSGIKMNEAQCKIHNWPCNELEIAEEVRRRINEFE